METPPWTVGRRQYSADMASASLQNPKVFNIDANIQNHKVFNISADVVIKVGLSEKYKAPVVSK